MRRRIAPTIDRFGHPVKLSEWFLVPLHVIDEAVRHIRDGSIADVVCEPDRYPMEDHAATSSIAAYHASMITILRNGNMEVAKVVTPSGVTGYVATCIPREALSAFAEKLDRKIAARRAERLLAKRPIV